MKVCKIVCLNSISYFGDVQIDKAKTICECLIASEGSDLKLEEAFCLFLLGQVYILRFILIL